MFLPGPEPGEQRKKDGYGSRLQQSDGLPYGGELQSRCRLQTRGVLFREGEGGRRRYWCVGKGGCTPPYIGQGGCHPPPLPHVELNSQGGECAGQGGWWTPPLAPSPRGETPSSLNGPHGPI